MRISLSWLKEYIPISASPAEIARLLTMAGLEVDHWKTVGNELAPIVVATVLETTSHPNADKLQVARVTDGKEEYQIVCGAPNCRPGIKTALARIGVTLTGTDGTTFTIKKAKIRGVESMGMLCSGEELGLSNDREGILELPADVPLESSLASLYGDTYFDVSLTPNLSHCMSVFGIARELAAVTEHPLSLPSTVLSSPERISSPLPLHVQIEDQEACRRYACQVICNVTIAPSPAWLKQRLEGCGIKSINNVVDVTNYVLHELGHPLHAFDLKEVTGEKVVIRKAFSGETLTTLDGKERSLDETILVIADGARAIAIAGIIGGAETEIREQTQHVLLEAAYFDPRAIRRASKRLGIQTEASKHFERGTDPKQVVLALNRAAQLIQQVAGGELIDPPLDVYPHPFIDQVIRCRLRTVQRILGNTFGCGEIENAFKRLGFSYQWGSEETCSVVIPPYRHDLTSEIDLVEEVARLYGYDNLPRQAAPYHPSSLAGDARYLFEREMRECLIGKGLQECVTCSLIGPSLLQVVHGVTGMPSEEERIQILNPTSIEQSMLRPSLLPGLLQVVKHNHDHQVQSFKGFEIGQIHFKRNDHYHEQSVIACICTGEATPPHWSGEERPFDLFDLKGLLESLLEMIGVSSLIVKPLTLPIFHPGRQGALFVNELELGSFGEIHPAIQRRLDVPHRLLFAELNLANMMQVCRCTERIAPLPLYPCSERDWTVTVPQTLPFAMLQKWIEQKRPPLLAEVTLKDLYRGEQVPMGQQNLTFHFIYRDLEKTVEQEAVEQAHRRFVAELLTCLSQAKELGYE